MNFASGNGTPTGHPQAVAYCVRNSTDVDEHAGHISAWEQEYDQISSGRFCGRVRELWLPEARLQLFHEYTWPATSQRCASWPGSVWVGFADVHSHQPLHFCGSEQAASGGPGRALMCASASAGFTLRTPANFGIYGVVMDLQWLQAQMEWLGLGHDRLFPERGVHMALLDPGRHAALCSIMEQLLALGQGMAGQSQGGWDMAATEALLPQLLALLCDASPFSPAHQAAQRRLALVMAARDMVSRPLYQALGVDALCQQLHVTRRTLQNHFQSVLGQSPSDFLKAVRLNACRRALRDAQGQQTVQDIAARWGFYHMGHFSQDYKRLFGALPSKTLHTP
ncbi:helix-turn-helix domain-containing protein [Comamonas sp. GB3 AK4-5]|uniref:helix-turn-helix domain-containing protein n=1 Tax=Comamonas sp. GB3 AK4-5 TaxID=3231487 RepID=UPI00351EF80B